MQTAAVIYIVLAVLIFVGMFVRSRIKAGTRIFSLTKQDKADLKEVRAELGIRRVIARLMGGFGGVLFVTGASFPLHHGASTGINGTGAAWMFIIGLFLTVFAVALLKVPKRNI